MIKDNAPNRIISNEITYVKYALSINALEWYIFSNRGTVPNWILNEDLINIKGRIMYYVYNDNTYIYIDEVSYLNYIYNLSKYQTKSQ